MATNCNQAFIAYGSESGNAEQLARKLLQYSCFNSIALKLVSLNQLPLQRLTETDFVLIISSTFGDGEPPSNAEQFAELLTTTEDLNPFQYAIFSLGDVAYLNFCKFGRDIDIQLQSKGAIRAINRVDADIDYQAFFQQWIEVVASVFAGNTTIGAQLQLRVTSYNEASPHKAEIINILRLNSRSAGVYHIDIDISQSGMNYRAGDLLYVQPNNQTALLQAIATWYGDKQAIKLLRDKELRLLSKSLLRTLAKRSDNISLQTKLKVRNKEALANYLYGRDLLDILQDCGDKNFITLADLAHELPLQAPRAYSICSSGQQKTNSNPTQVSVCIRDIAYEFDQRMHYGTASHWLCQAKSGDKINIFVRSNPNFHLEANQKKPIIMIGSGTGIAPYIGFLQQLETQNQQLETLLIFGERYQKYDFLYQTELERWLKLGILNHLATTFSRDQKQKHYVQHAMIDHAEQIWTLLDKGALVYVCGNKDNLAKAVTNALISITLQFSDRSFTQAEDYITELINSGRYRQDLY